MVLYRPRWDPKLGRDVLVEVIPTACPHGHVCFQRPGWSGADGHSHRTYRCSECDTVTVDPDCETCQRPASGR